MSAGVLAEINAGDCYRTNTSIYVGLMNGGKVTAAPGGDTVETMNGGAFNGVRGNDDIFNMDGGTFADGPGDDTVSLFEGSACWSVSGCD